MKRVLIERNRYFDSVFLMRISHDLEQLSEVDRAIVAMATPANLANLRSVGFAIDESASPIHPNDLVIAVDAESEEAIADAEEHLQLLLTGPMIEGAGPPAGGPRPMTITEAIQLDPAVNIALISVPGAYAAREARQALQQGLHVMLFSDNVSVEDEIALKDEAIERGLLMMGPDCGTAILNGAPLGFANVVRRGSIGIVGASGTGIQEISSLVHRLGGGISQAIGTGGRDLSASTAARMTLFGIDALASDPETKVIVVVSKAPEPEVAERVVGALKKTGKPCVVHFVAGTLEATALDIAFAETLSQAAASTCERAGLTIEREDSIPCLPDLAMSVDQRSIRGLYCGGTLAQEAWSVLRRAGIEILSNVAADPKLKIQPGAEVEGHVVWDLGDDAFTVGKPHPMIEPSLRDNEVARAGSNAGVGIILVDCVLGYGAHEDPAGSLADAVRQATDAARQDGRELLVIASVTGTDADPQNRKRQVATLAEAGVLVAPSNADAARWAIEALQGGSDG